MSGSKLASDAVAGNAWRNARNVTTKKALDSTFCVVALYEACSKSDMLIIAQRTIKNSIAAIIRRSDLHPSDACTNSAIGMT